MKADLTRDTFDAANHFRRVLHQQGRVTLDADPNEQSAILLHYLQSLARDLIGPYGAPATGGGFALSTGENGQLLIGAGNFYVDGLLVENAASCSYAQQPDFTPADADALLKELRQPSGKTFWVYLDVWERHVSWIEHPALLEQALGGVDTTSRSKLVWQVKALEIDRDGGGEGNDNPRARLATLEKQQQSLQQELEKTTAPAKIASLEAKLKTVNGQIDKLRAELDGAAARVSCAGPLDGLIQLSSATLAARVDPGQVPQDACTIAPDAQYRGAENQLYRVEIHRGGAAGTATFKWARDNGSVAAAWLGSEGRELQVSSTQGFVAGNWVELSHDALDLNGETGQLVRLVKVDGGMLTVDPDGNHPSDALAWSATMVNPKIRRWDQVRIGDAYLDDGAVPVSESGEDGEGWLHLEDGVQIRFAGGGNYRSGDYWLVPARVASGKVEWPQQDGAAALLPARGIRHHYAPLGFIGSDDGEFTIDSCRCEFGPLRVCP